MKKLFISGVVLVSLLGGSASSVGASIVANSNKNNSIVSVNHVKKQRDHVIYHVRRNKITNHANHSKVVIIRFNGHKESECKLKKHETVEVFGQDSKIPTLLNHTKTFFTKHGITVTYSLQDHFSRKW